MGKSYSSCKQTHWGQTNSGQINVHHWCQGGGIIKIASFFYNGCPTDISSTVFKKYKNFFPLIPFFPKFLSKIYKVAELPSLTDLQEYKLVTALLAVIIYGNFPWYQIFFHNSNDIKLYGDTKLL